MKTLQWIGTSRDDVSDFPAEARREVGFELFAVQSGHMPSDFKPMPQVGKGAYEIRIHVFGEWRVIYVARMADVVYVLHAFQKKTQKTRKEDLELAARRYRQITGEGA
jgi:phage-related protein